MQVRGLDDRIHDILQCLPRILRSDRPPGAQLGEVARLTGDLLDAPLVAVALLKDNLTFGPMGFSCTTPLEARTLRDHHLLEEARAALLAGEGPVSLSHPGVQPPADARGTILPRPRPLISGDLLGVRLRSGSRMIGLLCVLSGPAGRTFSPGEALLLDDLGRALGAALDNGMLLRETLQARRWMRTATFLSQELLAGDLSDPLRDVADRAMELADADAVAVTLVRDGRAEPHYASGPTRDLLSRSVPLADSLTGRVVATGEPLNIADIRLFEGQVLVEGDDIGPTLVVPLHSGEQVTGSLKLGRSAEAPPFTRAEEDMASAFAAQASVALELVAARRLQDQLLLVEERDRIARDLHDHIVQRLFATGLSLNQAVGQMEGKTRERVMTSMLAIDETIRQIRNTILTLRSAGDDAVSLTDMVTDIASEAERLLGFAPLLSLDPGTREVKGQLALDLAACVREAMSNVVRHAKASQVIIKASMHLGQLTLSVTDDGSGILSTRRSGLANLAKRAEQHGGFFEADSTPGLGTALTWRVPVVRL